MLSDDRNAPTEMKMGEMESLLSAFAGGIEGLWACLAGGGT